MNVSYFDARNFSVDELKNWMLQHPAEGAAITAWQAAACWTHHTDPGRPLIVTVPDFLNYGRMINTGQAAGLLKLPGIKHALGAGVPATVPLLMNPAGAATMNFWVFAEALMRYDLSLLPWGFEANVMLHSYLADFAFAFEKRKFVRTFFSLCDGKYGKGLHTQQLPRALSCLARWSVHPDIIGSLHSPATPWTDLWETAKESFGSARMLLEVGSLPESTQRELLSKDGESDLLHSVPSR